MTCIVKKLSREVYALTFFLYQMPYQANMFSKKSKPFNYKQYKRCLREVGDMALNNMHVKKHFSTAAEILSIPIEKFITLSVNSCKYSGKFE